MAVNFSGDPGRETFFMFAGIRLSYIYVCIRIVKPLDTKIYLGYLSHFRSFSIFII